MKGVSGFRFNLNMWYGDDELETPRVWVSPWAEAHYKLRQQEIEIEQCEFRLQQAVEIEDYAQAGGLKERVERMRSNHPIIPREERIAEAIEEGNFELAAIFQRDLEAVKQNLGLPKYVVGQFLEHKFRKIRGVVIDIDLVCTKDQDWIFEAACDEKSVKLGQPPDECSTDSFTRWSKQPFYTVLLDLSSEDHVSGKGAAAVAAWVQNEKAAYPAPLYLPEEAMTFLASHELEPQHPELNDLFAGFDVNPSRGRIYRPSSRLRLWQQQRAEKLQAQARQARGKTIGVKLGDGTTWLS